ncbi:protein of unknown function [Shewanella benthica]|uniref:Uncharacterized protein n=1 Tax=Shewanella benthica TaxID=43661 RepID=A0A330M081_9GAMM|nr:protein of unknown function [Shewanella benthica]
MRPKQIIFYLKTEPNVGVYEEALHYYFRAYIVSALQILLLSRYVPIGVYYENIYHHRSPDPC